MVVISLISTVGSWGTAFFSWVEPTLLIAAVAAHTTMGNIRSIGGTIVAVRGTIMTLVVSFIVIGPAFANWNRVARMIALVVESFWFAFEATHILIVKVVLVIETVRAVFRAFITPIVGFIVISAIVTHGPIIAELGCLIEEVRIVVTF